MIYQKNSGFSLIEVIIAMAIFTIGTLGLYGMQINSATWNTRANQQTSAVLVANQVVEQLMQADFNDAALDFTDSTITIDNIGTCHPDNTDCHDESDLLDANDQEILTFAHGNPGSDSLINSVKWIVEPVNNENDQPINNMIQIHVSVNYGNRDRDVVMSFLKVNLPTS